MNSSQLTIESLLTDESFLDWIDHSNEADDEYWENWLKVNPDQRQIVDKAVSLYMSLKLKGIDVSTEKIEESLQRVNDMIEGDQPKTVSLRPVKIYRYAAVISLIVLSAIAIFIYTNYYETITVKNDGMLTFIEKVTPKGQKSTTTLSDGTVIKLNSDSRLKFPKHFSKDVREIYFEGEAFFDVAKDPSRPFIIKTRNLQIQVLGTSFNVNSFDQDNLVEVGVLTGRVGVQLISDENKTTGDQAILLPNEKGIYNKETSKLRIEKFNLTQDLAWKDGIILFHETDFDKVIERLERWYGFEFDVREVQSLKTKLTGRYDDKSLKFVLDGICYSLGINYKIDKENKIVTLKK